MREEAESGGRFFLLSLKMKESNSRFQIIVMLMKINENNTDEERIIRSAMNFKNKFPKCC